MSRRKTVVFHINHQKQIFGEFHENTKVKMIKSYFKDVSHINCHFDLNINGNTINNDELMLIDINKKDNRLLFRVILYSEENGQENNSLLHSQSKSYFSKTNKILDLSMSEEKKPPLHFQNNQEELLMELHNLSTLNEHNTIKISSMENEILTLHSYIEEQNNKLMFLQKSLETMSLQNLNANKFIEQLKQEYAEIEERYRLCKESNERLEKLMFSMNMAKPIESKRKSINNGTGRMSIVKDISNGASPRKSIIQKRASISNSNPNIKRQSINSTISPVKRESIIKSRNDLKQNQSTSIFLIKQENTQDIPLEKEHYSLKGLKNSDSKSYLKISKHIRSEPKSMWPNVFSYLGYSDHLNYSLSCKKNLVEIFSYWYDLNLMKAENINEMLDNSMKVIILINL
jgi:hypothetical protein